MAHRSIDDKYLHTVIKEYRYWTLMLCEEDRGYLGRAIVWIARNDDMLRLSALNDGEMVELWKVILPEYESALHSLWQPDHMNYEWLGNYVQEHGGHGHMHIVPRYKAPREFANHLFEDKRWGIDNKPCDFFAPSNDVFLKIRDALRAQMY